MKLLDTVRELLDDNVFIREAIFFLSFGGFATIIQYIILAVLIEAFFFQPYVASGIGYLVGGLVNYYLNYKFTFQSGKRHQETMVKFFTIAFVGLMLNTSLMKFFTYYFYWHYIISQLIVTSLVTIWNFTCNKFWTFKEN